MIRKIIISISFILLVVSCEEASTIDPYVKKTVLNPGDTTTPADTKFRIDSVYWQVMELYADGELQYEWMRPNNINKSDVFMDTSLAQPGLWIDLEIESPLPANIFGNRMDRVSSFRVELDSSKIDGVESLSQPRNSGRWSSLSMIEDSSNFTYEYKGTQLMSNIFLQTDYDLKKISGFISISIPEEYGHETTGIVVFYNFYF